jgi:hypothetical protein
VADMLEFVPVTWAAPSDTVLVIYGGHNLGLGRAIGTLRPPNRQEGSGGTSGLHGAPLPTREQDVHRLTSGL